MLRTGPAVSVLGWGERGLGSKLCPKYGRQELLRCSLGLPHGLFCGGKVEEFGPQVERMTVYRRSVNINTFYMKNKYNQRPYAASKKGRELPKAMSST